MNMKYEKPKIERILFNNCNILTASGDEPYSDASDQGEGVEDSYEGGGTG